MYYIATIPTRLPTWHLEGTAGGSKTGFFGTANHSGGACSDLFFRFLHISFDRSCFRATSHRDASSTAPLLDTSDGHQPANSLDEDNSSKQGSWWSVEERGSQEGTVQRHRLLQSFSSCIL